MRTFKSRIILILLLGTAWILMTQPFNLEKALAGGGIILLILLIPLPGAELLGDLKLNPKALVWLIAYVFFFLYTLIKSNLDVAFRVLHPKLPIRPGVVKVKTSLRSPLGRLMLANSITLTPGTITVESDGEDFYIHWIAVKDGDVEEKTRDIVSGFEKYLEVICG